MSSPLFEDVPLPKEFRGRATTTWAEALKRAEQMHSDTMPEFVGELWCNGWMYEHAQQEMENDPIFAAALLLVLCEQDKLLIGNLPR